MVEQPMRTVDGIRDDLAKTNSKMGTLQAKPKCKLREGVLRAPWQRARHPDVVLALSDVGWQDLSSSLVTLLHPAAYCTKGSQQLGRSGSAPGGMLGLSGSVPAVALDNPPSQADAHGGESKRDRSVLPSMMRPNGIGVSGDVITRYLANPRNPSSRVATPSVGTKGVSNSAHVAACLVMPSSAVKRGGDDPLAGTRIPAPRGSWRSSRVHKLGSSAGFSF